VVDDVVDGDMLAKNGAKRWQAFASRLVASAVPSHSSLIISQKLHSVAGTLVAGTMRS
jgi:hypothetical protein